MFGLESLVVRAKGQPLGGLNESARPLGEFLGVHMCLSATAPAPFGGPRKSHRLNAASCEHHAKAYVVRRTFRARPFVEPAQACAAEVTVAMILLNGCVRFWSGSRQTRRSVGSTANRQRWQALRPNRATSWNRPMAFSSIRSTASVEIHARHESAFLRRVAVVLVFGQGE